MATQNPGPKPKAKPADYRARDGNATTGYDQLVARDGDASNQARTRYGFDGNAMTAPNPKPKLSAKPKVSATPKLGPKPPAPQPPKPFAEHKEELEFAPAPKPRRRALPTPFRAPRPRPPR